MTTDIRASVQTAIVIATAVTGTRTADTVIEAETEKESETWTVM